MVSSTRNPRDCSRVPNSEMREGWTLVASMPLKPKSWQHVKEVSEMHSQPSKQDWESYGVIDKVHVSKLKRSHTWILKI